MTMLQAIQDKQMRQTIVQSGLTSRELECVKLAASGLMAKEIAGQLKLSKTSIDRELCSAQHKLNVKSRVHLAHYSLNAGWVKNIFTNHTTQPPHPKHL